MAGIDANTTLLGAITIGLYGFIAKFVFETFKKVWMEKKANGDPPASHAPAREAAPANIPKLDVMASDAQATRKIADKIKSDTSHLKLTDAERASTLKDICESNTRQETQMGNQTELLGKLVDIGSQQLVQQKKSNGG